MTPLPVPMPLPIQQQACYLACPRCGLVVLQGSDHDGSPVCRDCIEEDETAVRMDVLVMPIGPGQD